MCPTAPNWKRLNDSTATSGLDSSPKKVRVLLPYNNGYRVSLLKRLKVALRARDINLVVAAGSPSGGDKARGDSVKDFQYLDLSQCEFTVPKGRGRLLVRRPPRGWLRADLVILEHATRNLDSYLIIGIRRPCSKPTGLRSHGMTIAERQTPLQSSIQRWMLRNTSWLFAYTDGSAARGIANGAQPKLTSVLNNTFDYSQLKEAIKDVSNVEFDDDRWVATYIGGLDAAKRIDVLIRVAKRVHEIDPRFLLFVGGKGDMEEYVKNADESPWLEYLGNVDDRAKARIASRARMMLIPGRVGLAAIDSFVMETPIVAMGWEFHAPEFEYLTSANSVVVSNDENSYLAAILDFMNDPGRLTSLTNNASADADKYPIAAMIDNFACGIVAALGKNRSATK
jgi:glycosyltransferase involved in cell wall biosynthesis